MSGQLLTAEDCARRANLSKKSIYRAITSGHLQAYRLCGRLRIDPADLEDWIASNRVETPQRAPIGAPRPLPASNGLRSVFAAYDGEGRG